MIVLDAYPVIAYLRGEPVAGLVARLLKAPDRRLTALGVAEVLDHLVRVAGAPEDAVTLDLAALGLLDALPVEVGSGIGAGRLRARHYHRTRCAVSLADCVAAQTARSLGGRLATSDPHLLDLCHAERIEVVVLPGADGSTWSHDEPP